MLLKHFKFKKSNSNYKYLSGIIKGKQKTRYKIVTGLRWYHLELNQGHTDFQSVALPTELWYQKNER